MKRLRLRAPVARGFVTGVGGAGSFYCDYIYRTAVASVLVGGV